MTLGFRKVALLAALMLIAPSPVNGGKGKNGSRRSSSLPSSSSSSSSSGSPSKSSGPSHSSSSSSRSSSRSRGKGKGSSPDVPDDLFKESASGSSDEEKEYPAMSPAMQDLLFRSSEETNSTNEEGSNGGVMPFPGAAPVPPPNALPTLPNPTDDNAKCVTTNGTFGLPMEEAKEQLVVSFQYTVMLVDSSELTQEEYMASVVPALETEMNNFVVPVLFGKACGGAQQRRRHHRVLRERHGISALPADRINDDNGVDHCADIAVAGTESNKCFSMLGQVTLYHNNTQRPLEDDAALFQETLHSGMNAGVFDNQPPIQKVAFVPMIASGDEKESASDRGVGDDKDDSTESSGGPDVHRIVTITWFTILGVLLVAAVVYVVLRVRRSPDDEQMQSLSQRA